MTVSHSPPRFAEYPPEYVAEDLPAYLIKTSFLVSSYFPACKR